MIRRFAQLFTVLVAVTFFKGCGSDLHPAVHDPLMLVPSGADAVMVLDNAASRSLRNFLSIRDFLRNRDKNPELQNALPFDYDQFVERWQLDPLMGIDKVVVGLYRDEGWVAVMNGQFQPAHMMALAQEENRLEGSVGQGASGYPVATVSRTPLGGVDLIYRDLRRRTIEAYCEVIGRDAPLFTSPRHGPWFEALPSEHLWIVSNNQALLNQSLNLYDTGATDNLSLNMEFQRLWTSRPRESYLWFGVPSPQTGGQRTMQVEFDIRSYVILHITYEYETAEIATNATAGVRQSVGDASSYLTALPAMAADEFQSSPFADFFDDLGLLDVIARAASTLTVESYPQAMVVEVEMKFEIDEFKHIFARMCDIAYAQSAWTPNGTR